MQTSPRKIDPAQTFDSIAAWISDEVQAKRAPGLIVSLSGTDSILTFLACAQALEKLGMQDRLLGLNFGPKDNEDSLSIHFNWVADYIFPWLHAQAPQARLEIDSTPGWDDDNQRWGKLFSRAVSDTPDGESMTNKHYFPIGTRNATEDYLGTYAMLSSAVSMFPIID